MAPFLDPPLVPRNGRELVVLAVCRISTNKQDERSLADQEASYRRWLTDRTDLPYNVTAVNSQGSGECLDRAEYLQAIDMVESGNYDLVITEDLGRICRRVHAHIFCETCEDHNTRLIAINDHVDTGRSDWRLSAFFAVMRHETYNVDTAQRIRRSLRNRFQQGGIFQFPIYGYIKSPNAKTEDDVSTDPAAEPIFEDWFRRLEEGATFAEIADWLNENGISTGPYCRLNKWTPAMVKRVTFNPLLKGVRVRNNKMSQRVNKTGRRRAVPAPPEERLERNCPHLAFIEPLRFDRVIRMLQKRNAKYRRQGIDGRDTRKDVPKKRTTWPGQHLCCGICGRLYHWTGLRKKRWMVCFGAHEYRCWNSLCLDGALAMKKLPEAIWAEIQALPNFDDCFVAMFKEEFEAAQDMNNKRRRELHRQHDDRVRQIARVTDAVAECGKSQALLEKLNQLETDRANIEHELAELDVAAATAPRLPSAEEIKERAAQIFGQFTTDDPEVGRLMNALIPDLEVYPYQLCDGGAVVLRAKFTLQLAALIPNAGLLNDVQDALQRHLTVDLFDPPQRVTYRQEVMARKAAGQTERKIAEGLGIKQSAVQQAAALDRLMKKLGIDDPYMPVLEPPENYGKLRRHRHPRYCFEPLKRKASDS